MTALLLPRQQRQHAFLVGLPHARSNGTGSRFAFAVREVDSSLNVCAVLLILDGIATTFACQRPGSVLQLKTVCIDQAGSRMSVVLCRCIILVLSL
jgi:MFS-type transporter involved in bile tolerance (Atg22 family)